MADRKLACQLGTNAIGCPGDNYCFIANSLALTLANGTKDAENH